MSKTMPEFLKNAKREEIDETTMENLATLIESYDDAAKAVEKAEKSLSIVKKNFNDLALERIPEFLLSHGFNKIGLDDGREVKIKEDISATVSDELAFRSWLKERDEDDIIKIKYQFSRMKGKEISALTDFLIDNEYNFDIDESIHSQTKKKYFKELIKELGRDELPEWVSIYDIRKAVIK